MTNRFIISSIFSLLCIIQTYTQEINIEEVLSEELIEEILNETDGNVDFTTIMTDLSEYVSKPININKATADNLHKLHLLNDFQIHSLLDYRKTNGEILSIYELQFIYGFDKNVINRILPFITLESDIDKSISLQDALKYGKNKLFLRVQNLIEDQEAFLPVSDSLLKQSPNSRYTGSKHKFYTRYHYQYMNKISFGITAEKDPGEEFFRGSNPKGFDFYSGHLQINDFGRVKTISLGDYHAKFGQGLALWSGVAFGKSSSVMQLKKYANGIQRYTSVDENRFMRGAATTIDVGKIDLTLFMSMKKIDGNILQSDTIINVPAEFSSFQQSGYHRTPGEIEDEDAIQENIYGAHIDLILNDLKLGATAVSYRYDSDFIPSSQAYNYHSFSGNRVGLLSVDYDWHKKNFNVFGETSYNIEGAFATLNGFQANLLTDAYMTVIYRDYSMRYFSPNSNSLSENSNTENERGIYSGIQINSFKNFKISAYYDQFVFPWLNYNSSTPSKGYEYLVQVNYFPSHQFEAYFQYKNEIKEIDYFSEEINKDILTNRETVRSRFHLSYYVSPQFRLQNRIEFSLYSIKNNIENGYMTYQDFSWKPNKTPISITLRYIIFDTDGYNSRIYLYENDLLYSFSFPAMYDKGTRTYILFKYAPDKLISFQVKYGFTVYSEKEVISSGLSEIMGNKKSEIKAQVVLKF